MKVFTVVLVSIILYSSAVIAAPSINDNKIESDHKPSTFSRAAKFLGSCFESDDTATCLAIKGITALNRAARSNKIEVMSGITFTRNPDALVSDTGRSITESDVIDQLPAESENKIGYLMDSAMTSVVKFFNTHNLEIKVPAEATQELARAFDEGRSKLKKSKLSPIILLIGAKLLAFFPILLGGLALFTTKAIIVAKIAFLLALSLVASRFFGSAGSKLGGGLLPSYPAASYDWGQSTVGQTYAGSSASASYPYARSINDANDAHDLAYAGQIQQQ